MDNVLNTGYMFYWAKSLVWWDWSEYTWNHVDWLYAKIDGWEESPWYFTDKNHFAVRFLTYTWEELKKQWISIWETVNKLEDVHRSYKYYLP
jgi:hypothetical protein